MSHVGQQQSRSVCVPGRPTSLCQVKSSVTVICEENAWPERWAVKPRQISDLRNFLCSQQRPPSWFFQKDVLICCRISFLSTSSSEIEVCSFFAVRIGPSVVGDVLTAAVSVCQTCPFGNNRYKMLVQKVFAKKKPVDVVGFASPLKVSGQRVRALQSGLREVRGFAA